MKSFNWLHLTDLHFGLQGQETLWPNIRDAFWEDLKTLHKKSGPWHAVLFTGDLVQSGSEAEFGDLERKVLVPLWEHLAELGSKDAVLLTVPGNHDLARPDPTKPTAACRYMTQQNAFAEIANEFWSDPTCEYRAPVSTAFANYYAWSKNNNRKKNVSITEGILPGDFAASITLPTENNQSLKIGIAGINTTFLQLTKGDYTGRLAIDAKQLHHACNNDIPAWANSHDACILLTHQGPDWLDTKSRNDEYSEVNPAGRFAVHLFGHMHQNVVRSTAAGGGPIVRQWQGTSLFGLERFGEPPQTKRRHGYAAGRIAFHDTGATICHWPRLATKDTNGWRFIPDHNSCVLVDGDCTNPEPLNNAIALSKSPDIANSSTAKSHLQHLDEMKLQLQHALEAFKGQPIVFVEPKLSKTREFNNDANELHPLLAEPSDTIIIAPPEFGLTCLGLHFQLEAFKNEKFWLYIDADHTKGRKIADYIDEKLLHFGQSIDTLKCVVLDSWDVADIDHLTMVRNISSKCPNVPLILLAGESPVLGESGSLAKLKRDFKYLHLQALSRSSMRQLVAGYNAVHHIGTEDVVLSGLAEHLESINIHRTALNCYTLLRVLDSSYNEKLINKSKLLKALLFVLFTDADSFSFASNKPEVEECMFVLGCFCKDLVKEKTRTFDASSFATILSSICKTYLLTLDVDTVINVLLDNNILVRIGEQMEFRHRYLIFYFAAEWMRHDEEFRQFILKERNYVKFPEIIEFYAGIDGKRTDAMEVLHSDLTHLIEEVAQKIGIKRSFDPLSPLLWTPSDEYIQKARSEIAEKVESSNLPASIKDEHADSDYQSAAPYDQRVSKFLNEYSVQSLLNSIKAASRALRSSHFVDVELRQKVASQIFNGWEEISRVAFWLSPLLAKEGMAIHEGLAIRLANGFSENLDERFTEIITSNPANIVRLVGCDLASKKICPLLIACFRATESKLQKHMIAIFIAIVRPVGWYDATLNYINLLHPRSFYLGKMLTTLSHELTLGDLEPGEEPELKRLTRAIISKCEYAKGSSAKEIPPNKLFSEENKLPIDQLVKGNRQS